MQFSINYKFSLVVFCAHPLSFLIFLFRPHLSESHSPRGSGHDIHVCDVSLHASAGVVESIPHRVHNTVSNICIQQVYFFQRTTCLEYLGEDPPFPSPDLA